MEKIYMEDSSRKSSKSRSQLNLSVVLSFVVAFFAIFSLMACGISQVSYAAPQTNPPSGDFTFYEADYSIKGSDSNNSEDHLIVIPYFSDAALLNPIFCIEHHNQHIDDGQTVYTRDKKITDNGLVYILEHSYVNGKKIFYTSNNDLTTEQQYVETWATQAAIWYYLYLTNASTSHNETDPNYLSESQVNGLIHADKIVVGTNEISANGLGAKVKNFVDDVIANHRNASEHNFELHKDSEELDDNQKPKYTKTNDGKYYQSKAYSMTSDDNPVSYTVSLSGDVEGAFICDSQGNPITGTLNPSDTFYVRMPVESVSENEEKHVNIQVTAEFNLFAGYEFKGSTTTNPNVLAADHQRIVSLVNEKVTTDRNDALVIIGAPDTSMSTAQTIYFIGLVVLLCGIGIVYANAKPAQSKQ